MREIKLVVLHYSATDYPHHDNIAAIRKFHLDRGWSDVGYNYFIRKDGVIERGRPLYLTPAHCKGHNLNSIGICLSGLEMFHVEQFEAAANLIYDLRQIFGKLKIKGHKELVNTKCPNFNIRKIKELVWRKSAG